MSFLVKSEDSNPIVIFHQDVFICNCRKGKQRILGHLYTCILPSARTIEKILILPDLLWRPIVAASERNKPQIKSTKK